MAAAALAAAVGLGATLLVPVLRALAGSRSNASRASDAARSARSELQRERAQSSKLRKAVELARKQGGTVPPPPVPTPSAPPVPPEPPIYDVELGEAEIKSKSGTLASLGSEKPTKKQSAERLYQYVSRSIHEGRLANLGTKEHGNAQVAEGQREMGGLKVDGIYGDKTRARGKELTGKPWPARPKASAPAPVRPAPRPAAPPAPPKPAPAQAEAATPEPVPAAPAAPAAARTPVQAARELLAYVQAMQAAGTMAKLGSKSAPNTRVLEAQRDMGGIAADGIYGLQTRTRGKELLGTTFPPRA